MFSLALTLTSGVNATDLHFELVQIHYDLEVANYCGVVNNNALAGFNAALQHLKESENVTDEDVEQARMQAWKDAYWEWQNRGLGGFKGWCANEALEGARRLESYLPD